MRKEGAVEARPTGGRAAAARDRNAWFRRYGATNGRSVLVCFPHAGVGASAYRLWPDALGESASVIAVQLPGREDRIAEEPIDGIAPLVAALASNWPVDLVDVAFFGHSMGALIAFELARTLRANRAVAVKALFVSAHSAPHLPDPARPIHHLDDAGFVSALGALGGTPQAVLEHQELLALALPALRADFAACETYEYQAWGGRLTCPIHAFYGTEDPRLGRVHMAGWIEQTSGDFSLTALPGDHFYLVPGLRQVASLVAQALDRGGGGDQ